MIESITFDLWNTIFQNKSYSDSRINFLLQYLKIKGFNDDKFLLESCYDHIFLHYSENPNGNFQHIYNDNRIDKVLKCLKVNLSTSEKVEIQKVLESAMLNDPPLLKAGVVDTLKELSSRYKIGLISNTGITPGEIIKKVLEKYEILKFFQVTIFSDEIGYYKPYALLFQKALTHLGSKPENSIHIGDLLYTDVKGAKDYGMLSIWFNDLNQKRQQDIIPNFEVSNIKEIIKIIKSI